MDSNNAKTLEAYDENFDKYVEATLSDVTAAPLLKEWLDKIVEFAPAGGDILEIGSGTGRDADYLESKGLMIKRSDASNAAIRYMSGQGHSAEKLNILQDEISGQPGLVLADAVLLHFSPTEVEKVLQKIYMALDDSGVFAFTTLLGVGSEWTENKLKAPRFMHYWQADEMLRAVKDSGFVPLWHRRDDRWLMMIARKS